MRLLLRLLRRNSTSSYSAWISTTSSHARHISSRSSASLIERRIGRCQLNDSGIPIEGQIFLVGALVVDLVTELKISALDRTEQSVKCRQKSKERYNESINEEKPN